MSPPTVRAELAAAYRAVNAAYARLPELVAERVEIAYDGLDAEIDTAILADDRDRALAAVAAWRRHWLATLGDAGHLAHRERVSETAR